MKKSNYRLYERSLKRWVVYSKSAYEELHHARERIRKQAAREGSCVIPWKKTWYCDGQCDGCPYRKSEEVSLDMSVGDSRELILGEALSDGRDHEDICIQKMYCEDILKKLDEIMPQARQIGLLRLEGKSDREIARELGIDRMTMLRMLARVKAILQVEL